MSAVIKPQDVDMFPPYKRLGHFLFDSYHAPNATVRMECLIRLANTNIASLPDVREQRIELVEEE